MIPPSSQRPPALKPRESERGAVAIMVAVFAVAMFALGAYVIDVGALFEERRDLQNGADAAVLAVAVECASAPATCATTADLQSNYQTLAESYASPNANDLLSAVADMQRLTDPANSIGITTATLESDASPNEIDFALAPVIGQDGHGVTAYAQASWAGVATLTSLPLTFGLCEFNLLAGFPIDAPPPVASQPIPFNSEGQLPERTVFFHDPEGQTPAYEDPRQGDCSGVAGQDNDEFGANMPGGFGWLQNGECLATIGVGGWVEEDPGNDVPSECDISSLQNANISVPLYDCVWFSSGGPNGTSNGPCTDGETQCPSNKCYRIFGWVSIQLTGYGFAGGSSATRWPSPPPCMPPYACIRGIFQEFTILADGPPTGGTGPNLGLNQVWLSG